MERTRYQSTDFGRTDGKRQSLPDQPDGKSGKKSYVCRREDPKDRRNKLVYLTEAGEAFHQWIAPELAAYYERLEQILGKEKISQTEQLLKELQDAIENY